MHISSDKIACLEQELTSIQDLPKLFSGNNDSKSTHKIGIEQDKKRNLPVFTTGQLFLHSRSHFHGLHFLLSTNPIRLDISEKNQKDSSIDLIYLLLLRSI